MSKRTLWILAIVVTLASALYPGSPDRPIRCACAPNWRGPPSARLERSHSVSGDLPVRIRAGAEVGGEVVWRRYPTDEPWQNLPLAREGEDLVAALPTQPSAGKLEYRVRLARGESSDLSRPGRGRALQGRRAGVGAGAAHPLMFLGMLLSNAAGLSALARRAGAPAGLGRLVLLTSAASRWDRWSRSSPSAPTGPAGPSATT